MMLIKTLPFGPSPGPQGAGAKKCAVAHPIHVSNTHTKFGWILSNGLGGESVTDGCDSNIPDAFLKSVGIIRSLRVGWQNLSPSPKACT